MELNPGVSSSEECKVNCPQSSSSKREDESGILGESPSEECNVNSPLRSSSKREEESGISREGSSITYPTPLDPNRMNEENIFSVGRQDLDPFGGLHGIQGLARPLPGAMGGGMMVGPEHPMFQGVYSRTRFGDQDIFGGPQRLPRGSVPPGARFDPIGPFGPMPPLPQRGSGQGRGQGGGGPLSGEPDFDEMPPPGYNDMFM